MWIYSKLIDIFKDWPESQALFVKYFVMIENIEFWTDSLNLARHPEGGWYREVYRSREMLPESALPEKFGGSRALCTAIYFLLAAGEISALHRIKSDEIWYFHSGDPLTVSAISPAGDRTDHVLGLSLHEGQRPQALIPAGSWFGARHLTSAAQGYTLCGCSVAPGFAFEDFELGERETLLGLFPGQAELIISLTRC